MLDRHPHLPRRAERSGTSSGLTMGGLRLVIVAVAIWLVWRLVRTALPSPEAARRRVRGPERMEKCAFCDVHVPASESVHRGGRTFCGETHADAYEREPRS